MKYEELKAETVVPQGTSITLQMYGKGDVDAAIAELKEFAENACLERDDNQNVIDELESENRRLKRALWLAREWRAWCEGQFWLILESNRPRDVYHLVCTNRIHRTPNEWMTYWQNIEQLCKKKAEEYK